MIISRGHPTATISKSNITSDTYWSYYQLLNLNDVIFTYQFYDSPTLTEYEKKKLWARAKKLGYKNVSN